MTYEEFLQSQASIYAEIEQAGSSLLIRGIQPNIKPVEIPLICYRYEDSFSSELAAISQDISSIVPALTYSSSDIHTTIATLPTEMGTDLVSTTLTNIDLKEFRPKVRFEGVIWNQDSGIAKGIPNRDFFDLSVMITESLGTLGLEVKVPKMAHITLARFSDKVTDRNKLSELELYLKAIKLNKEIQPMAVELGKFTMIEKNVKLTSIQSFSLID